jgi:hypothetical protein
MATLYWDPDGIPGNNVVATGAGLGGGGSWTEAGAATWFDPTLNRGAGGYVAWNTARGDTAVFAGPAGGTVTIAGRVGAAGVEFRGGRYTVQGEGFATRLRRHSMRRSPAPARSPRAAQARSPSAPRAIRTPATRS